MDSRVGSLWAWKRRKEPGSDPWEQGDNIPEEQNWEERTGMDNDPKEQAEQDSPVLARSLVWPHIILFLLKQINKTNQPPKNPPKLPNRPNPQCHPNDTGIKAVVGKQVWYIKKMRSRSVPSGTQLVRSHIVLSGAASAHFGAVFTLWLLSTRAVGVFVCFAEQGEFYWGN